MVGERGFEPPTPWSRTRCSTRLSHSPTVRTEPNAQARLVRSSRESAPISLAETLRAIFERAPRVLLEMACWTNHYFIKNGWLRFCRDG
jgi:hypothetical protein